MEITNADQIVRENRYGKRYAIAYRDKEEVVIVFEHAGSLAVIDIPAAVIQEIAEYLA